MRINGLSGLLAGAAAAASQLTLAALGIFAFRLADNESSAANVGGAVEFVVCQNDLLQG
jgi:hypothetical protein